MIFVRLAIGTGRSGSSASSTCPESRSARIAASDETSGGRVSSAGVRKLDTNGESEPFGPTGVGGGPWVPGAAPASTLSRTVTRLECGALVELGRSIRTVGDMVSYGPNVPKL